MTGTPDLLPADEVARLEVCAQEPIHVPGSVQAHGVLLAVDPGSAQVVQVSANADEVLGREPSELLGTGLGELVGRAALGQLLAAVAEGATETTNPVQVTVGLRPFDAIAHRSSDGLGIVELEPRASSADEGSLPALHAAMQRLSRAHSVDELRAAAAREVRRLTGFDRVMVYHFHPDGHGEVVAEDRVEEIEPYLGLHYPASDIPAQARRLYVLRGSRNIPSSRYEVAPLVPSDNPRTGAPTDLSFSELRSVSPHHLQFMRNMGVGASLSISLVDRDELIGMISCGHRTTRHISYDLRRGCEILAQQVTLQMRALSDTRRLERRLRLQDLRTQVVEQMVGQHDMTAGLVRGRLSMLDLISADGAVACLDGRVSAVGETPPAAQIATVVASMRLERRDSPLVTDALSRDRPDLAALLPSAVGLVVVPVGDAGDYLAWFRRAIAQNVDWLGDQSTRNRATPLSPRSSFHRWRQTVTDRALAWEAVEVQGAVELREVILRHVAQERARRASVRTELTARISGALAETLDAEEAVARLAHMVVPALAEWCIVTLVDEEHAGHGLKDVSTFHARPEMRPLVERYAELRLGALTSSSFLVRALRSGEVVSHSGGAAAAIQELLAPGEARELIGRLAPEHLTVLPLRGRNRTVGLITLFHGAARGALSRDDLATARVVADRAGLALDNARLYRQQRQLAEGLQRSLLTEPPQPDDLEIVVRYVPAGEAAKVGGDWYDAFLQRDGATMLVIGDVVGHDITAAAAMGQLRSIMRGIAVATGADPADLLQQVDVSMHALRADTIATAVVAKLEQTGEERARGVRRLRWSNAGHPEPVVLTPDGAASALTGAGPELVLGVVPGTRRTLSTTTLAPGTTVFFYTDGLVERRTRPLWEGTALLHRTLRALAGRSLDDLCDEVLGRMLPAQPDDDVALVAVRMHSQD